MYMYWYMFSKVPVNLTSQTSQTKKLTVVAWVLCIIKKYENV